MQQNEVRGPDHSQNENSVVSQANINLSLLLRPVIREFADAYAAVPSLEETAAELGLPVDQILKLDAGENPFLKPPSFDLTEAIEKSAYYPDSTSRELREALAEELGVTPDMIVTGNGSDELIDLVCRLFLESGRRLADFTPTFPMYKMFAKVAGGEVVAVPREDDFSLSESAYEAARQADLTFLANPNNPTGTLIDTESIRRLLDTGKPIVVDEAYFEFCGQTVIPLLAAYKNLIVLRTFSKWAGIAGLRIGFGIAHPELIAKLNAIKAPYNTNMVGQAMAKTVLAHKNEYLPQIAEQVQARDLFIDRVNSMPDWTAIPSQASCVCISSTRFTSNEIASYLYQRGILVRVINGAIPNTIRISIGPGYVMDRVLRTLKELDTTK